MALEQRGNGLLGYYLVGVLLYPSGRPALRPGFCVIYGRDGYSRERVGGGTDCSIIICN